MNTALKLELAHKQSELADRVAHVTGINFKEIIERVYELGVEYRHLKAGIAKMEFDRPRLRARIAEEYRNKFEAEGKPYTEARLANLALMDSRYGEHIEHMEEAEKVIGEAGELYYAARAARDAATELNKTYRDEIRNQR